MDSIEVNVGGRGYRLSVEGDQESRVRAVAEQFDSMVKKIREASPQMERDNLLVMAALMMSDELLTLKGEAETRDTTLAAFHNDLADRLEKLLPSA